MTQRRGDTRDRIMVQASRLFAERGYHGTSTRDIAAAVGTRQPSIYKHFATKHLILAELIDADLVPALHRIRCALALEGPVAPRIHAFLRVDVAAILALPYDVRGLYNDEVLLLPELAGQAQRRDVMHDLTDELVSAGIDSGELVASDASFVQHAITGLMLEVVRERGPEPATDPDRRACDVADFVLRGTLADPADLAAVRRTAEGLMAEIASPPPTDVTVVTARADELVP